MFGVRLQLQPCHNKHPHKIDPNTPALIHPPFVINGTLKNKKIRITLIKKPNKKSFESKFIFFKELI